jgi:hypothetical protein
LWRGARRRPDLRRAAAAEHHDLWRGDVPRITTKPGSQDGFHHAVGRIPGMLAPERAPAPDVVARLDELDLERQQAFVVASLHATAAEPAAPVIPRGYRSAADVARRLAVLALREGDRAGWLTAVDAPQHSGRVLRLAGPGLADGHAGIALFLARYADATGDDDAAGLAQAAARQAVFQGADGPGTAWALAQVLGEQSTVEDFDLDALDLQPWGSDPVELPGLSAGLAGLGLDLLAQPSRGTTSRNSSASVGRTSVK